MEHIYNIDDDVLHQFQGPQGRDVVEASHVYTILALLPVEADGRPRYRIKSKDENFERVVAEDLLSRSKLGAREANAVATQTDPLGVPE
jgi:hypothetical protein